jgi:hypothetical protein
MMTALYRLSATPPPFGLGSLWTTEPAEARRLAQVENGGLPTGDGHVLYRHEADLDPGGTYDSDITAAVNHANSGGLPLHLPALRRAATQQAPGGTMWARLVVEGTGDRHWLGAILQLHAGPVAADRVDI